MCAPASQPRTRGNTVLTQASVSQLHKAESETVKGQMKDYGRLATEWQEAQAGASLATI